MGLLCARIASADRTQGLNQIWLKENICNLDKSISQLKASVQQIIENLIENQKSGIQLIGPV